MIDYDTPRFKTSEVADAAGVTHATVRTYFKRGYWRMIGKEADSKGLPNEFSTRDALVYAVAGRLIKAAGLHPKAAFDIAVMKFAHAGRADRLPAHMFNINERGETLLIYWPFSQTSRIIAANDVTSIHDLGLRWNSPDSEGAAIIIVLNQIEQRVFASLGIRA